MSSVAFQDLRCTGNSQSQGHILEDHGEVRSEESVLRQLPPARSLTLPIITFLQSFFLSQRLYSEDTKQIHAVQ